MHWRNLSKSSASRPFSLLPSIFIKQPHELIIQTKVTAAHGDMNCFQWYKQGWCESEYFTFKFDRWICAIDQQQTVRIFEGAESRSNGKGGSYRNLLDVMLISWYLACGVPLKGNANCVCWNSQTGGLKPRFWLWLLKENIISDIWCDRAMGSTKLPAWLNHRVASCTIKL